MNIGFNITTNDLAWHRRFDLGTVKYILILFLLTRVLLTTIGALSQVLMGELPSRLTYSSLLPLDVWGAWDAGWYVDIANNGYSTATNQLNQANYAYFPLFPSLMVLLKPIVTDSYIAGLIISNVSLIVAAYYLFMLVRLDYDSEIAQRAIKYMFLFPVAFVLSSAFTESLYLALAIACFYYARTRCWLIVGLLSFILGLTKALGVLIALPLMYEYLKNRRLERSSLVGTLAICALPVFGLALFAGYLYQLTGDPLAFTHIQASWGAKLSNPIQLLMVSLVLPDARALLPGWLTLAALVLLVRFGKEIKYSYLVFALYSILVPLSKTPMFSSMPRYVLVAFPLYILLGCLSKKSRGFDTAATAFLVLLQGFLMIFWSTGSDLIT